MKRKITSFILCLAMLVSIVAVLPVASSAADTTFKGTDVTLTDGVLLNFYIEANEAVEVTNAQLVNGQYVITEELAAKEMGKNVTVQLKNGETPIGDAYTSSVKEYAQGILESNDYDAVTKALVQAMLNYGAAAQKYFNYETDSLVGTPVTDTTALKAATVAPVDVEGDGFIGASLILEGTMTLRFYFAGTVDSATVDGEAAGVNADAAEYCYVDVKVTPDNIDKAYEVVAGETTVKYSVLNYLKNNADDAALSEMVASIYEYSMAAESYLVDHCTHEEAEYKVTQLPTLFSKGLKIAHCDRCGEEARELIDETVPKSAIFDENVGDKHTEKLNVKTDVLGNKHFYPTVDDPEGNDLFIEFSFLWNETLANNANAAGAYYLYLGMLCDSSGDSAGGRKTPYHLLLVDDIGSKMWCQYAGGFESDNNTQIIYGPSIPDGLKANATEADYPMIGDYGWHRIGIQLHQTSKIVSGSVKHDVIATLYVDGVKLSAYKVIYDADNSNKNLLYTAKVENGEIVYTGDVADDRYVFPYMLGDKRSKPGTETYFSVADVFVTAGDEFVIDVEKLENPEEDVFEFENETQLDGTIHFEVIPNEIAIAPDDEEAKNAYDFIFSQDRTVSTDKYTNYTYNQFNDVAEPDAIVPGLQQGFIPQGMDISEEKNLIFISGYFKDNTYSDTSVILTVNAKTGKMVGEYRILNVDGSRHTSHAGGVAVTEDNVFIASESKLFRIPLSAFEEQGLQATIQIAEEIRVPTRASFCNYSDGILWVGDFYIPNDRQYATPSWRHMTNRDGKEYGAWCVGYRITDETESGLAADAYTSGMQYATPDIVLSIDQKFQGFTVIGDKIVLSRSYGNQVNSTIIIYNNVTEEPVHTTVTLNGKSVPVWFLDSGAESESYVTMPMSQGLSVYDGALYVLYESGALCFHDGWQVSPTDRIFKMTLP